MPLKRSKKSVEELLGQVPTVDQPYEPPKPENKAPKEDPREVKKPPKKQAVNTDTYHLIQIAFRVPYPEKGICAAFDAFTQKHSRTMSISAVIDHAIKDLELNGFPENPVTEYDAEKEHFSSSRKISQAIFDEANSNLNEFGILSPFQVSTLIIKAALVQYFKKDTAK